MLLDAYDNNPALRQVYHRRNGMTHAFAWHDEKEESRPWTLYLGGADWCGFPEANFESPELAREAAFKHHPELEWLGERGD